MVSSKYKVTKEEKVSAENWFSELRDNICSEFQNIEKNISNNTFQIKNWKEAKDQNRKTFKLVQNKLSGFFSDFPNPKGDR